jgi:cytochrome oxidase Cu insertion factor (SCO1/SenC/PrrC family)
MTDKKEAPSNTKAKIVVGLMFAMFIIPYVYVLYIYKTGEIPTLSTNEKGSFFSPFIQMKDHHFETLDYKNWKAESLEGKWVLMNVADQECSQICLERAFNTQQAISALTRYKGRVDQVFLINKNLSHNEDINMIVNLKEYTYGVLNASLIEAIKKQIADSSQKPVADLSEFIIIVDPEAQLLLWYHPHQSIQEVLRDIKRLLKSSAAGYSSDEQ